MKYVPPQVPSSLPAPPSPSWPAVSAAEPSSPESPGTPRSTGLSVGCRPTSDETSARTIIVDLIILVIDNFNMAMVIAFI